MEKLFEAEDKQVSSASIVPIIEFDEKLFQPFMLKNPVWDFHGVSREDYLCKCKGVREQLILSYYNTMVNSEQITFLFLSFKEFSNSFNFFCSKYAK